MGKKSIRDKIAERVVSSVQHQDEDYSDRKDILNSEKLEEYGLSKWTPPEGDNFIQLLPLPFVDDDSGFADPVVSHAGIGFPIWVHWRVGVNQDSYLCLRKMFGQPCPVCEEFMRKRKAGEDWDNMKHLSVPNKPNRWLFYMVDVSDSDKIDENGVQVFLCPVTVEREMSNRMVEKTRSGEVLNVRFLPTDPDEARIFKFNRKGSDRYTDYTDCEYLDPETEMGQVEELPDEFYDNPEVAEILNVPAYEEIKQSLYGVEESDNEDDELDLEQQSREVFGGDEPDEEEEPEEEVEEEEVEEDKAEEEEQKEVEEKPRRKRRSRKEVKTKRKRRSRK